MATQYDIRCTLSFSLRPHITKNSSSRKQSSSAPLVEQLHSRNSRHFIFFLSDESCLRHFILMKAMLLPTFRHASVRAVATFSWQMSASSVGAVQRAHEFVCDASHPARHRPQILFSLRRPLARPP